MGLNEKEASVYLALLELGTATVESIAKKAGTKRPTTYLILDSLKQSGLVNTAPRAKKALYTAESPEKLLSDLNKKEELLKRFMPNLLALHNTKKEKPRVLLYEGKEAMIELYEKILNSKEIDWFATVRDFVNLHPGYSERLVQRTLEKKTKVREILTQHKVDLEFANAITHSEYYQHKFTKPGKEFLTDNGLFDGNVAFFSYQPYLYAVAIQSQTIYASLRVLFDLAWQSAEPYEKTSE